MSDSVFIGSGNFLIKLLEETGIEPKGFLEQLFDRELDFSLIHDPNARLDYRDLEKAWVHFFEKTGDDCLGLRFSDYWHPGHLGALGHAWLSSNTLYEAFVRLERFIHMISKRFNIELAESHENYLVIIKRQNIRQGLHFLMDGMMAVLVKMCRMNYGKSFKPLSIHLVRPEPECKDQFDAFFQCPIKYGAKENSIMLDNATINSNLSGSNSMIADMSDRIIIAYLGKMDESSIIDRVKSEILNQLPNGNISETSVASSIHKSSRTIQRLLNDQGTSFSKLVNETRMELALKYLKDSSLSLTEIAFMLGFSESSAFSRAFKRWTGIAPSAYKFQELK